MNIHHIALKIKNLALCENFYRDVLQLKVLKKNESRSVWFDLSGTILMIEKTDGPLSKAEKGWHLLALAMQPDQRDAWKKRLADHGVEIESESPYSLYFRDPEQNRLALSHYPKQLGGV